MLRKVLMSAAAVGLIASPVAAQEASMERAGAIVTQGEELAGENSTGLLAMFAVIAVIVATAVITTDDDDQPTSP